MTLTLVKAGVSTGLGVADIIAEYVDEKRGYNKSFMNVTDWLRTSEVVLGYAANAYNYGDPDMTESVVLSAIPLLEKSLYGAVKEYVLEGKGKRKGRMGLKLKTSGRQPNVRYI